MPNKIITSTYSVKNIWWEASFSDDITTYCAYLLSGLYQDPVIVVLDSTMLQIICLHGLVVARETIL
jgi:hypothetical protein